MTFPSDDFADAQVRPGETLVLTGTDAEGHLHTLVLAGIRPRPWTAFARAKRQTNGQPYAAWKESAKAALLSALGTRKRPLYPREAVLGLAISFGARKSKIGNEKRTTSVLSFDATNLRKAYEDVMSGLVYADDDQVRWTGPGAAVDTMDDFICAHVWSGGAWRPEWADYVIPTP